MVFIRSSLALAALVAASVASAANFHLTYTSSINGPADLYLTTSSLGGGQYLVTGLTGTHGGLAVSLIPGGPAPFLTPSGAFIANNVLYVPPTPDYFDVNGLGFTTSEGEWNLFGNGGSYTDDLFTPGAGYTLGTATDVTLTAVPGPLAALPFGLLALRRKRA